MGFPLECHDLSMSLRDKAMDSPRHGFKRSNFLKVNVPRPYGDPCYPLGWSKAHMQPSLLPENSENPNCSGTHLKDCLHQLPCYPLKGHNAVLPKALGPRSHPFQRLNSVDTLGTLSHLRILSFLHHHQCGHREQNVQHQWHCTRCQHSY